MRQSERRKDIETDKETDTDIDKQTETETETESIFFSGRRGHFHNFYETRGL